VLSAAEPMHCGRRGRCPGTACCAPASTADPRIRPSPQHLPAAGVGAAAGAARVPRRSQAQGRTAADFWTRRCASVALHGREVRADLARAAVERDVMNMRRTAPSGRWWHRSTTAASSATCARATASCTTASAAPASCAEPRAAMVLTTYGRSSGFCVDPIEKKPLNHFYPGTSGAVLRHRRLQPGLQVLPELGHQQVARHGPADGPGQPAAIAPPPSGSAARASPSPTTTR
jgi:hypothetical protein